ncbi:hypothetical protein MJO28_000394 [Puccinia striiformis f. sp. tritici]|uniref:Uncharacterized protein n=1 Tax=Puccinia striiformis f. sp. tritici TaxID=168172 RepID=A0ACC0EXT5_9BASI|nr:hypothetical protein MJO28_000394 [Puccinia striiformis f. sp. tritici]
MKTAKPNENQTSNLNELKLSTLKNDKMQEEEEMISCRTSSSNKSQDHHEKIIRHIRRNANGDY